MEVRLLRHWRGWKPGKVFCDMGDGAANQLIKRGAAEEVDARNGAAKAAAHESNEARGKRPKRSR